MVKPFSEQLSALSVQAKSAEDAAAAAKNEAREKILARRNQAHAAATKAVEQVNRDMKSARDAVTGSWKAFQAKVAADVDAMKSNVADWKHERDAERAAGRADRLEWEASLAIDYAVASVEQAKLAVLDAVVGRVEAEEAKRA